MSTQAPQVSQGSPAQQGQGVDIGQLLVIIGELETTRRLLVERLSAAEQRIEALTATPNGDQPAGE